MKRSHMGGGPWHFLSLRATDTLMWFNPNASIPMALAVRDLVPVQPFTNDPRLNNQPLMWATVVADREAALRDAS